MREELLLKLGQRLGLSQREIHAFVKAAPKRRTSKIKENESTVDYQQISLDVFEIIEEWQHYAILELMKVRGFKASEKWVAKALGITVSESRSYIERLVRVGLLEIRSDGSWQDRSAGFSSHILNENETTYAHQRSQKQILQLAVDSLERISIERRDQSSMMMATSTAKIAAAKKKIQKFRREICEFLEEGEEKDSVYQLSISLFPLIETHEDKYE